MKIEMHIDSKASFLDFLDKFAELRNTKIYRGVSSNHYKLIPSIGRLRRKFNNCELMQRDEEEIFRLFKQRSKPFLLKEYDESNLLAIAQHHGLPTRLLDWTFNPLAAAYFAVETEVLQPLDSTKKIQYSVIYIHDIDINKDFDENKVDFLSTSVNFFIPNYNDDRIINQNGLFTVHPLPCIEYKSPKLKMVSIDLEFRRDLRRLLNRLGINQSTIYPGLDGTAGHIKWMETNYY